MQMISIFPVRSLHSIYISHSSWLFNRYAPYNFDGIFLVRAAFEWFRFSIQLLIGAKYCER